MKASTITKTLKALAERRLVERELPESLGFSRYWVLPDRVRKSMNVAHFVETGSTNAHFRIVEFFGGMNETEYKNWLVLA